MTMIVAQQSGVAHKITALQTRCPSSPLHTLEVPGTPTSAVNQCPSSFGSLLYATGVTGPTDAGATLGKPCSATVLVTSTYAY